jgi:branched-chain amino acid aminotransferase
MSYFNYNGKIFATGSQVISADSRALRYGDGLFETIKYKKNSLILADEHFNRLWKGMQLLKFDIPKLFTPEKIMEEIKKMISKNKLTTARVRLGIFRGEGGLYDTKNNIPDFIIQTWPLAEDNGSLNTNGLELCIYEDALKSCDAFCNIKHNNYLPYFMGAFYAKENRYNDAIILNTYKRICDSTIANIFIVKDEIIYTPSLKEGCVAGVLRKFLIQNLPQLNLEIKETDIDLEMLLSADEVFLTNSIYNLRWVSAINNKTYTNKYILKLSSLLAQTNPEIFC